MKGRKNKCALCARPTNRSTYCEAHYYQIRRNGKIVTPDIIEREYHSDFGTPEYTAWAALRGRCLNPKNKVWKYYGGRGIGVCKRWDKYSNFLRDMGRKPSSKHSLDRINLNGNYTPGNCRWATPQEQAVNRRGVKINHTLAAEIRKLKKSGTKSVQLAEKYKLNSSHIDAIVRGRCWK